jgi:hypothetical protein
MSSLRKVIRRLTDMKLEEQTKKLVKRKTQSTTELKVPTKKIVKRNNKYEYKKKGQKKETPPLHDPLRIFYTSLLRQKPHSELAIKWCIEHGLFPDQPDNICSCLSKLTL